MRAFLMKTLASCLLAAAAAAQAQDPASAARAAGWPSKPVRLIVPFAAGGGVDSVARTFATYLSKTWGQTVYVDNKPGAGGQIAGVTVATAAPDGYTLLVASQSLAASSAMARTPTYDPVNDLAPVGSLVDSPSLFVVNTKVKANTIPEFIAWAKANPGKLNYGSTGVGSGTHLAMETFKQKAGIEMTHVPYNGEAPMYSGLFSNEVQASVLAPQSGLAQVRAGRLKVLAVTAQERSSFVPDAPSMGEVGIKDFEYKPWIAIFAPGKTPPEIIRKINADAMAVLNDAQIKSKYLVQWGSEAVPSTPEAFKARYLADLESYRKIVRDSRVPLND